jgi:hypothetical protein
METTFENYEKALRHLRELWLMFRTCLNWKGKGRFSGSNSPWN